MAVSDYSTTPALNTLINGIDIDELCPAPNLNNAIRQLMADISTYIAEVAAGSFPTGTVMLFAQTAAPTGWTKLTDHDNAALRVVSGTAGSGGTGGFTSAFNTALPVAGTTDAHAISITEMPAHFHGDGIVDTASLAFAYGSQSPTSNIASQNFTTNGGAGTVEGLTQTVGGGGGHTHSFTGAVTLAVAYVDVIRASKD